MKLQLCLILLGFVAAAPVSAQVYKCTLADNATRQTKVIYTDAPCTKAAKQTLTSIQVKSNNFAQSAQQQDLVSPDLAKLDSAVTNAVLNRDFKLAKSLASTKEHWRLIAIAEGEPPQLVVANTQPVVSRADECAQAKDSFEYVSRNAWRDKDLVAAKKSLMYVACGVQEPINNQPIFVGQRFGGFQSGRLIYPNAGLPYYPPHAHRPHHAQQPYTYINRFGQTVQQNHQEFAVQNHGGFGQQTGFSLDYSSSRFGFSTGGFNAH